MNPKEEEFYNDLGDMFGDLFKSLGAKASAHPEFKPTYYENVDIIYVWIALRKIVGVNHWAVIYKLSNDKYGITQFDTTGKIGLTDDNVFIILIYYIMPRSRSFFCQFHALSMVLSREISACQPKTSLARLGSAQI